MPDLIEPVEIIKAIKCIFIVVTSLLFVHLFKRRYILFCMLVTLLFYYNTFKSHVFLFPLSLALKKKNCFIIKNEIKL